jgi:hypothetical protein
LLDGLSHTAVAQLAASQEHLRVVKGQYDQNRTQYKSDKHSQCHRTLKTSAYEERKDINPDRVAGTCQWVLNHLQYRYWHESDCDGLLWISADPGCGKSVLAKSLVDVDLPNTDSHITCYFFFKDNEEQDSLATALCALLHQLFNRWPLLIRHAMDSHKKNGNSITKECFELWRIWLAAVRDPEAPNVTCILDALDECREGDRVILIDLLTKFHLSTSSSSSSGQGRLKILVTSRPYDDIQRGFQTLSTSFPTIRLRGEDENDRIREEIDLVIRMRVAQLANDLNLKQVIWARVK